MTGVARVFKHAAIIVIAIVELIEYWVASLRVLPGALYG
jgi:hypothetical protein